MNSLRCEVAIVGTLPCAHDAAAGVVRLRAEAGQHVFAAVPGRVDYIQDGGRAWRLHCERIVLAEPAVDRRALLQRLDPEVQVRLDLGSEPELRLGQLLGCELEHVPARGGWNLRVGADLQTSVPGVEVAGDGVFGTPFPAAAVAQLRELAAICPCERVPLAAVEQAAREFGVAFRAVKTHTRAGMGLGCQGMFCRTPIQAWMQRVLGYDPASEPPPVARVPLVPVDLATLLAAGDEA